MEKVPQIEIHRRMQAVYGDRCVDVRAVRRWVGRFKDGELGQSRVSKRKHQYFFFFRNGFQKLVQRWWQCVEVRGDFVEK